LVSLFYFLGLFTICLFFKGVHEVASLSYTDFFLISPISLSAGNLLQDPFLFWDRKKAWDSGCGDTTTSGWMV